MKQKIYITSLHLQHGGIEMAISLLANALVKREYEVEILCTYNLGAPVYFLDKKVEIKYLTNVKPNKEEFKNAIKQKNIFKLFKEGLYSLKVLYLKKKVLKDAFGSINDGIIISTRNEDSVLLSKYGKKGVLKIAQLHHDHRFIKKLLNDFKNHYKNIDIFTLLTDQLTGEVSNVMKNNHYTRCVTMPNFLPEIEGVHTVNKKRLNQCVAVGRLDEVKGFSRLIKIWANVSKNNDAVLKIIGGGELEAALKNEIEELNLTDRVILTGPLSHDKVLEEMSMSKAYLMTSFSEGFPFVLIEAMSQGLPAIAYDVRVGPRAIIIDNKNGFLIEEDNINDFTEKVEYLLNNNEEWQKMRLSSLNRAKDFTEEKIIRKWEELFN